MKKKKETPRLFLQKKTIVQLSSGNQEAIVGGMTAQTTCCTSNPYEKKTVCCSLASCPPEIC